MSAAIVLTQVHSKLRNSFTHIHACISCRCLGFQRLFYGIELPIGGKELFQSRNGIFLTILVKLASYLHIAFLFLLLDFNA